MYREYSCYTDTSATAAIERGTQWLKILDGTARDLNNSIVDIDCAVFYNHLLMVIKFQHSNPRALLYDVKNISATMVMKQQGGIVCKLDASTYTTRRDACRSPGAHSLQRLPRDLFDAECTRLSEIDIYSC